MREITDHIANPVNDKLKITAVDAPGAGGANHVYMIHGARAMVGAEDAEMPVCISFQKGPIGEFGVNGITQEALLAIVIDRLRSFQAGPFACEQNHSALKHAQISLDWLKQRTAERMVRGVEGKSEK